MRLTNCLACKHKEKKSTQKPCVECVSAGIKTGVIGSKFEAETKRPKTKISGMNSVGLYRAKLSCAIARDTLNGAIKRVKPENEVPFALFNLCYAIEEIAVYLDGKEGAK